MKTEWEYDPEAQRDTGCEHCCVSVRYPDGTLTHRETHGADVAHEHYQRILSEHVVKNRAYKVIIDALPARMKKPMLDSDGDPVLDKAGQPRLVVKDKHKPKYEHLGGGRYEFAVPGIDEATHRDMAAKLLREFGESVLVLKPSR